MISMPRSKSTNAFTLLEVILAVALTAVIMVLIAGAIDMHLRQLTTRRAGIEEAQLARAILRRISDDLRAVVVNRPVDFGATEELDDLLLGGESGMDGLAPEDDLGLGLDTETADELAASGILPDSLGIYGNLYELHIDVSRLPRYEEYELAMQMGDLSAAGSLGDVKTVSYFLLGSANTTYGSGYGASSLSPGSTGYGGSPYGGSTYGGSTYGGSPFGPSGAGSFGYGAQGLGTGASGTANSGWRDPYGTGANTGLARRVVDRSSIRFAQENGDALWLDQQAELFAPEVVSLEFAYFDGIEWLLEWDTELNQGLPQAVEILLVLRGDDDRQPAMAPLQNANISYDQTGNEHLYRLVVHLPSAEPVTEEMLSEDPLATEESL